MVADDSGRRHQGELTRSRLLAVVLHALASAVFRAGEARVIVPRTSGTLMAIKILAWLPAFALIGALAAQAQTFPVKPVTMIVPFPAGGGSDILARLVGDRMRGALRQTVIVENR